MTIAGIVVLAITAALLFFCLGQLRAIATEIHSLSNTVQWFIRDYDRLNGGPERRRLEEEA
jgi:hypothetical protein